jgi:hypothetical protein
MSVRNRNTPPAENNSQVADTSFEPEKLEQRISTEPATAPNPFDSDSLRLPQNYAATKGVKKVLLTIPVRKPDKSWFIRVHPDDIHSFPTMLLELRGDPGQQTRGQLYLVAKDLRDELVTEPNCGEWMLFTAMNRQRALFLWPVRRPADDGRLDTWNQSALDAAQLARQAWVRIVPNMSNGGYDVLEATGTLSEPEWPAVSHSELLEIAFRRNFIDSLDHPVLRNLRGEV